MNDTESKSDLFLAAREGVEALVARLPGSLRDEALRIGFVLAERDDAPDGADTLGDYTRSVQRITLYLHALREHCADESLDFMRELVITYLHELGHHLGLPEGELERRGL